MTRKIIANQHCGENDAKLHQGRNVDLVTHNFNNIMYTVT